MPDGSISPAATGVVAPGDALAAVRRLSETVLVAEDPSEVSETLVTELGRVLGADALLLEEIAQGRSLARGIAVDGGDTEAEPYRHDLGEGPSGVALVSSTGEPLVVADAPGHPALRQEHVERFDIASCLMVPIRIGGEVRSVAVVISRTRREYTHAEVDLARTLADQAAAGLAMRESDQRRRDEADHQRALVRAAKAMSASLDLGEVLSTLCRESTRAIGADSAGVCLADPDGRLYATAGHGVPDGLLGQRLDGGDSLAGRVMRTGEPAVTQAYRRDLAPDKDSPLRRYESALSVPLRWGGDLRGALSVGCATPVRFSDEDVEAVEALADLAGLACHNAEAYGHAQTAARTDSLTGVLNHGAMQLRLAEEIARARRDRQPLSCLIIDLDNFKALNDRAGHLAGDDALRRVAAALKGEFRPYDELARYGGDEFVLMLPGTGEDGARSASRRVRAQVHAVAGRERFGVALQASVGIAQWREPQTAAELLERADRALLLAKRTGKARAAVASERTDRRLATTEATTGSSRLMGEFWDLVAGAATPRDALIALPAFARRTLGLAAVALYEPEPAAGGLRRVEASPPAAPDDRLPRRLEPGPAFAERSLAGPLCRDELAEILAGLDLAADATGPPGGSFAAVTLFADDEQARLMLLLHSRHRPFPVGRVHDAGLLARQAVTVVAGQAGGDGSLAAVEALAAAIDARDNYTHEHSTAVVELVSAVAVRLGLATAEIEQIRRGALLHDVGKVAIPNEILHKPGPLTGAEWSVMRQHPVIGERILRRTPELAPMAQMVRHEHEHWDGTGYPDGLAGEEIPVGSRVILVCDAYHAMISRRPYREPRPPDVALAELRACAGSQFDPAVVAAFAAELAGP